MDDATASGELNQTDDSHQISHPGDIEAQDTPLGNVISDRPEVRDLTIHYGDGRVIVLVTFEGWGMPNGFAHDYDMDLVSAYVHDDRPLWKRVLNIGPPGRLVGQFIRARESAPLNRGGVEGGE